ncbi:MAG: sigma-54 interaction domain-containing protein [Thermodesulfobacteriota bacterium]
MTKKTTDHLPSPDVTGTILESISDGVFTVDNNWRITFFNRAAEKITGIPRKEALGRPCWEVLRSNMCEAGCALKKTRKEGRPFVSTDTYIINGEMKRIPVTVSTALLKDGQGNVVGCVETFRDHSQVEELQKELADTWRMGDIVSRSPAMKRVFKILPQVAESDSVVLIEGETGTGKELTAKAVHGLSFRKDKPFVAVNCGAFPDTLLESELFGYKAGAFTHAVKDKPGLFAAADGGTLFLDEIGDTSPAFQVRLLRVLEEHAFTPLGTVKKQKTDVRVIAATHQDLAKMVEAGTFRRDLFYRINVIRLVLPPLRQRMEDVPLLVDHFVGRLNRLRGKAISGIDHEALEALMAHRFPGNVRELENIIEYAFVLCAEERIGVRHLPPDLINPARPTMEGRPSEDPVKAAEIQSITDALARNGFNRNAAARDLGIHKSTLFRKMHRLGIPLPDSDGRRRP